MKDIVLFGHNGSGNHGCEALVRTTVGFLSQFGVPNILLNSTRPEQDEKYLPDLDIKIEKLGSAYAGLSFRRIRAKITHKLTGSLRLYDEKEMESLFKIKDAVCFSIGGDNYCYSDFDRYSRMNYYLKENNNKTILWGCSISPELLKNNSVIEDLKRYDLITARESITYQSLTDYGLDNVVYVPDTAFLLPKQDIEVPFHTNNAIGINISPLIIERECTSGIVLKAVSNLVEHILYNTDYEIALIPHVYNEYSDDQKVLLPLYEKFRKTDRIYLLDEEHNLNCCQLKYIISKLRFLVTARTHASIAGYSSGVPTLVVGYSVKSQGIATDIFGNYEKYVCNVSEMKTGNELLDMYMRLSEEESDIKSKLSVFNESVNQKFEKVVPILDGLLK